MGDGGGGGASSAIHVRRPVAEREAVGEGVRRGRKPVAEKGAAQMDRHWPTLARICAGKGVGHSFVGEAASGRRCGELGFLWDGELRDRSPANGLELGKGR